LGKFREQDILHLLVATAMMMWIYWDRRDKYWKCKSGSIKKEVENIIIENAKKKKRTDMSNNADAGIQPKTRIR